MAYVDIQNGDDSDGILLKLNKGLALADKSVITVDTTQDLRDLPMIGGAYPKQVNTLGALSVGDGGDGSWRWDASSTEDDDPLTVLLPTGHSGDGRWVKSEPVKIKVYRNYTHLREQNIETFEDGEQIKVVGRITAGDGGGGDFSISKSNQATYVGNDEVNSGEGDGGVYVAFDADKTGAAGSAIRNTESLSVYAAWYGAVLNDIAIDDTAAIKAAVKYLNSLNSVQLSTGPTRDPFLKIGTGSIVLSDTVNLENANLEGEHWTISTVYWNGVGTIPVFTKNQNTSIRHIRFREISTGAQAPLAWVDMRDADAGIDYGDNFYGVFFGQATEAALVLNSVVNAYLTQVRFNNAATLIKVISNGSSSNNRVLSINDFTVDFTQIQEEAVNLQMSSLFEFNLGNSDQYLFSMRNARIEGYASSIIDGGGIVEVIENSGQTLGTRALAIAIDNCGIDVADDVSRDLSLLKVTTINQNNFYPSIIVRQSKINSIGSFASGDLSSGYVHSEIPGNFCSMIAIGIPVGSTGSSKVFQIPDITHIGNVGHVLTSQADRVELATQFSADELLLTTSSDDDVIAIVAGSVSVAGKSGVFAISTEGSAATDDLTDIEGGVAQKMIIIKPASNNDIVVKHNVGNIYLSSEADLTLSNRNKALILFFTTSTNTWIQPL